MPKRCLALLASTVLALGCGGGSGATANPNQIGACDPWSSSNDMGTCGARVGSGTYDNSLLAKTVPVQLSNTDYAASVGYVSRPTPTSAYTSFVIPVVNLGAGTRCFVAVSSGRAGSYDIVGYASGSVGYSGTIYTDTCLGPSEQGYLTDMTNEVTFDQVSSISLTLRAQEGMSLSQARVFPQSFTYTQATSELAVVAHNTGSLAVDVSAGFHRVLLFDESDMVLDFSFLDNTAGVPLASGGDAILDNPVPYLGRSSRMLVMVDFHGVGTTGALTVAPSPEDLAKLDSIRQYRERLRRSVQQRW
jgi:hypothetical protein